MKTLPAAHRALASLILLAFASVALAQVKPATPVTPKLPAGVTQVASVEGVTEYRLANGLRVLLFPDATKPTTTVNMTYLVGSRHENYGETGMAHLLEHMVFKGTPSIPSIFTELGKRGMEFNGTTSFDRTNYYETFSADPKNLDWALKMESERMTRSTFSKADLDSEMTVVRNEFESGENNPRMVLWKRLQAVAFDWHNYGKTTIGSRADVENVDIARLRAFYRTYYQPDNAVLIVAGRFEPADTLAKIARYFGPIPKPTRALPRLYTSEPVQDGERSVTVRRVATQKLVGMLFRTTYGAGVDSVAIDALGEILATPPAGRLYRALVDTGKASSVSAWTLSLADPGTLVLWAQVPLEGSIDVARDAMLETLDSFATQPVTDEEVTRVRTKARTSYEQVFNDPERFGVALSEAIALGDWRLFFLSRDQWRDLKADDVQRVALSFLKPANRTIGFFIPDAKPDRAPAPQPVDVAKLVDGYKGDAVVAAGEVFDPSPANLDKRTERYTLPGGLKVALLPKKTRGETVRFALRLDQGDVKSLENIVPAGRMMGGMLSKGTQKRDRQAYEDEIDRLRAKLSVGGTETATSASAETVNANLEPVLRLAVEAMRMPAFPADEFEKMKRASLTRLEANRSEPQAIAQRALARHGNPYPKGDVRYSPTFEEDLAALNATTLDSVKAFHQRFVGASHGELAIVGDFDPAKIKPVIAELFGDWRSPSPYARVPDPYRTNEPAALRFETPDKSNAIIIGDYDVRLRDTDADYPAALVVDRLLGGSSESRLFLRLRVKDGLSYGVGSFMSPGQIDDRGTWGFYAIFPPNQLQSVQQGFADEFARALKDGFTDEEVASAKRAVLEERRNNRAQDSTIASALVGQLFLDRTFAESAKVDAAIEKLDTGAVNATLRKYLQPKDVAWAFAGDFAKKP